MNVVKKLHSSGAERSQVVPFLLPTSPTAQLSSWNYDDAWNYDEALLNL